MGRGEMGKPREPRLQVTVVGFREGWPQGTPSDDLSSQERRRQVQTISGFSKKRPMFLAPTWDASQHAVDQLGPGPAGHMPAPLCRACPSPGTACLRRHTGRYLVSPHVLLARWQLSKASIGS